MKPIVVRYFSSTTYKFVWYFFHFAKKKISERIYQMDRTNIIMLSAFRLPLIYSTNRSTNHPPKRSHSNRLQNDSLPWFLCIFFVYSVRMEFLRHYQYDNVVRDLNHTKIIDFSFVSCTTASRASLLIQANAFSYRHRVL